MLLLRDISNMQDYGKIESERKEQTPMQSYFKKAVVMGTAQGNKV